MLSPTQQDPCKATLLNLLANGATIIADVKRLSRRVPSFLVPPISATHVGVVFDFAYFKQPEQHESRIEASSSLMSLDEKLREMHLEFLAELFETLEAIYTFSVDVNRFFEQLDDGVFVSHSMESLLLDRDSAQMLAEVVYLYGVMLLLVERELPGPVRERVVVSYYRYSDQQSRVSLDNVCRLMRSTGHLPASGAKRMPRYPESLFERCPISLPAVEMILTSLRSDDLYCQLPIYPVPEQRSTALSNQAAMLFVVLFFTPDILHSQPAVMREIVDKHFADNWVVNVYMGYAVSIQDWWEPYKAARLALANTLESTIVTRVSKLHGTRLRETNELLSDSLRQHSLEAFSLSRVQKCIKVARAANVALRWLLLHTQSLQCFSDTAKKSNTLLEQCKTESRVDTALLLEFLLNIAQFEDLLRTNLQRLFDNRETNWSSTKTDILDRLDELARLYSSESQQTRVAKNARLHRWLTQARVEYGEAAFENAADASNRAVQLIRGLEEVRDVFCSGDDLAESQTRQLVEYTLKQLRQAVRLLTMQDTALVYLQTISDMGYAWELIDGLTSHMQSGIKLDPSSAARTRFAFVKLSTALDVPLLRLQQAPYQRKVLLRVSQYYSTELGNYVRSVLQIIPKTAFQLLSEVTKLQQNTVNVAAFPTRLDKDKLRDYALFEERYKIAELTNSITLLTEGVLAMQRTSVGLEVLDPQQMLEDGIRKELDQAIVGVFNTYFGASTNKQTKQATFVSRLMSLGAQLSSYRDSLEYISDHIRLCGVKLWLEELEKVVKYFTECASVQYGADSAPPTITDEHLLACSASNNNFMNNLVAELLTETAVKSTTYVRSTQCWYDRRTQKEAVTQELFQKLMDAISPVGVSALDRLLSFQIQSSLSSQFQTIRVSLLGNREFHRTLEAAHMKLSATPSFEDTIKTHALLNTQLQKHSALVTPFLHDLCAIGRLQLLRTHLTRELRASAQLNARLYERSLTALSQCAALEGQFDDLALEVATQCEYIGLTDPLCKIYVCTPPRAHIELFAASLLLFSIPLFSQVKGGTAIISRKPADPVDGYPLAVGLATLLRQLGATSLTKFYGFAVKHANATVGNCVCADSRAFDLADDMKTFLCLLEFVKDCATDIDQSGLSIDSYIIDRVKQSKGD